MPPIDRESPAEQSEHGRSARRREELADGGREGSTDPPEITAALARLRTSHDPTDFEPIHRHFFPILRDFFLSRRFREAEAEEMAQESLLRVWANLDRFRGDGALTVWIRRIGANLWKNTLRDEHAERRRAEEVELTPAIADSRAQPLFAANPLPADEAAEKAAEAHRLRQALLHLPSRMQACFELRLGRDLTYQEIADTLGIAVGTVQSQIHDGKERLRELLGGDLGGS